MSDDDLVQLKDIQIEPNQCPLSAPLALTRKSTLAKPVKAAYWTLTYEADISMKRHLIPLVSTAEKLTDIDAGTHVFQQSIDKIPTEGVKEKYLLQVGLLKLELRSGSDVLVSINMVTQVAKDE